MLVPLNLPQAQLKLTKKDNQLFVNCLVRKKRVKLTPEEWVRQHLLNDMIHFKNTPIGLISVEKAVRVNGLLRRYDVLVVNKMGLAQLLIECKAPQVELTQETVFQVAQYNAMLQAEFVVVSNGLQTFTAQIEQGKNTIVLCEDLPEWK